MLFSFLAESASKAENAFQICCKGSKFIDRCMGDTENVKVKTVHSIDKSHERRNHSLIQMQEGKSLHYDAAAVQTIPGCKPVVDLTSWLNDMSQTVKCHAQAEPSALRHRDLTQR